MHTLSPILAFSVLFLNAIGFIIAMFISKMHISYRVKIALHVFTKLDMSKRHLILTKVDVPKKAHIISISLGKKEST